MVRSELPLGRNERLPFKVKRFAVLLSCVKAGSCLVKRAPGFFGWGGPRCRLVPGALEHAQCLRAGSGVRGPMQNRHAEHEFPDSCDGLGHMGELAGFRGLVREAVVIPGGTLAGP